VLRGSAEWVEDGASEKRRVMAGRRACKNVGDSPCVASVKNTGYMAQHLIGGGEHECIGGGEQACRDAVRIICGVEDRKAIGGGVKVAADAVDPARRPHNNGAKTVVGDMAEKGLKDSIVDNVRA